MKTMKYILAGLLLAGGCVSCSNDEEAVPLMNPQDMLANNSKEVSLLWNGNQIEDPLVSVYPVDGDSTTLGIRIIAIMPGYDTRIEGGAFSVSNLYVPIETISQEEKIRFSGGLTTDNYTLSLQGVYTSKALEVECTYQVTGGIQTGIPYRLLVDREHFEWSMNVPGTVDWGGETYTKTAFAEQMMGKILDRTSEETTAVQIIFQEDGQADLYLQHAGSADFVAWMKVRYWYAQDGLLFLDCTDDQKYQFYNQWTGVPKIFTPPFFTFRMDTNLLPVFYEVSSDGGKIRFNIASYGMFQLLLMYVQAKGQEGLIEVEKKELAIFEGIILQELNKSIESASDYPPILFMTAEKQ